MHRLLLPSIALLLGACDPTPKELVDFMAARNEQMVVLDRQAVLLAPEPRTLTSQEPLKVMGESSSVCLALRRMEPQQDTKTLVRTFEQALQDVKLKVHVTLDDGRRVTLGQPNLAWSLRGKVLEHDELSACVGVSPCQSKLPAGSQVSRIEISAEPALKVEGIFWWSERGASEPPPRPAPTTVAAPASQARTSCSG